MEIPGIAEEIILTERTRASLKDAKEKFREKSLKLLKTMKKTHKTKRGDNILKRLKTFLRSKNMKINAAKTDTGRMRSSQTRHDAETKSTERIRARLSKGVFILAMTFFQYRRQ